MELDFRTLTKDEIDVRVGNIGPNTFTLLLYKDARVDYDLLDEVVGPLNWKKSYSNNNHNCTVSIWDDTKNEWISKEDVGSESTFEKEKGLASDSLKRACVCWGIGRELYSAPVIKVLNDKANVVNGKIYDRFAVKSIEYTENRKIDFLEIVNLNKKNEDGSPLIIYQFASLERAEQTCEEHDLQKEDVIKVANVPSFNFLSPEWCGFLCTEAGIRYMKEKIKTENVENTENSNIENSKADEKNDDEFNDEYEGLPFK